MPRIRVVYYIKADGSIPVREFIDSLEMKMRAKVRRTILLFQENGNDYGRLIPNISRMVYTN